MKTVRTAIGAALLLSLCACESPQSPQKEDTFAFLTPTWCLATLERNEEGEISQIQHLQYDEDDNWVQTDWDYGNNGSIDARTLREFEGGYLKAESFQRLRSENVDRTLRYERNSAGQILRYTQENGFGTEVFVRENSWVDDQLLRSDYDWDADGGIDYYQVYSYEGGVAMGSKFYDATIPGSEAYLTIDNVYEGDRLIQTTQIWKDGVRDETNFFEYDEFDQLVFWKRVSSEPLSVVWNYDEQGRLAGLVETQEEQSFRYVYSYDCKEDASAANPQVGVAPARGRFAKSALPLAELGAGGDFALK